MNSLREPLVDPEALLLSLDDNWGLPTSFYSDPDIYELDMNAVFRGAWQYLGPVDQLRDVGDVMVGFAADVPVVVTRAQDGRLHGFVNICRHRGYQVAAENAKDCRRLLCRYHAWVYNLDGTLAGAPGSAADPNFPKAELGLLPISVDQFGPMVLVNSNPSAASFRDSYPELQQLDHRMNEDPKGRYFLQRSVVWKAACNWKIWYDNFGECYHCGSIHQGSFAAAYEADPAKFFTQVIGRARVGRYSAKNSKIGQKLRANNHRALNIFPGIWMLQQDGLLAMGQIRPTSPDTTEHAIHYFGEVGCDTALLDEWIDLWQQTLQEDKEATEIQHKMLRSGALQRNRLINQQEPNVVGINRLTCEAYKAYVATKRPSSMP